MQMYPFSVTAREIIKGNEVTPRAKAPWELRDLQDFVHILNDRVTNKKNGIESIGTDMDGHLLYIRSWDKRYKELLAEPLTQEFMNFLLSMMLMHSLGAESPTKEAIQEIYGIKSEILKKHK